MYETWHEMSDTKKQETLGKNGENKNTLGDMKGHDMLCKLDFFLKKQSLIPESDQTACRQKCHCYDHCFHGNMVYFTKVTWSHLIKDED